MLLLAHTQPHISQKHPESFRDQSFALLSLAQALLLQNLEGPAQRTGCHLLADLPEAVLLRLPQSSKSTQ
jgi:hypothetical protein